MIMEIVVTNDQERVRDLKKITMTTTGRVVERLAVGHRALYKARKCSRNLDRGKR